MARAGHLKRRLGEEPAAGRLRDRGGARRHAQLVEDIGEMAVDGVIADEQALADRLVAEAVGDQPQHLDLAPRQARPGGRRRKGRGRRRLRGSVASSSRAWAS